MSARIELVESGRVVELRMRFPALGDGAMRVLMAFVHYGVDRYVKCLHRDELVALTGMRGSSVVNAGQSLVARGLALWDDEIGTEALHLNDFGLTLAIVEHARGAAS